jgi:hypothetical protein
MLGCLCLLALCSMCTAQQGQDTGPRFVSLPILTSSEAMTLVWFTAWMRCMWRP